MTDEYGEYHIRLVNLPVSIGGFCYHDDDGSFVIVLNARLTHEANASSYLHELTHITRGDPDDPAFREYA
ncbi:MAG: hypothetical protein IKS31_01530 [Clostridia bacterium]|nr:hypothetical protein [Clostridia bacterium]